MKNKPSSQLYKLALFGDPVSHSLSPQIHQNFADQFGLTIDYQLIQVSDIEFPKAVTDFFISGGIGANITLPHKSLGLFVVDKIKNSARMAHAVNTLYKNKNSEISGSNTDGKGFVKDIAKRHGFNFKGKSVLILGAGGATQGIVPAILNKKPSSVTIANRSKDKAQMICKAKNTYALSLEELIDSKQQFDLIIHASSLGHQGKTLTFETHHIHENTMAYDLSYGQAALPFIEHCHSQSVQNINDGLGMLVEQAAYSFKKWFGLKPKTNEIYQLLKSTKST